MEGTPSENLTFKQTVICGCGIRQGSKYTDFLFLFLLYHFVTEFHCAVEGGFKLTQPFLHFSLLSVGITGLYHHA